MQMVEQAVQRLKGQIVEEEPDPTLPSHVSAFIPEDCIVDPHQRLSLYKRLSSCTQVGDLALSMVKYRIATAPPLNRWNAVRSHADPHSGQGLAAGLDRGLRPVRCGHARRPKAAMPRAGDAAPDGPIKDGMRFVSPLAFELQMPHQDWASIFPELTATLQSLGVCDTNTTAKDANLRPRNSTSILSCMHRDRLNTSLASLSCSCVCCCWRLLVGLLCRWPVARRRKPKSAWWHSSTAEPITQTEFDPMGRIARGHERRVMRRKGASDGLLEELVTTKCSYAGGRSARAGSRMMSIRDRARRYKEQLHDRRAVEGPDEV